MNFESLSSIWEMILTERFFFSPMENIVFHLCAAQKFGFDYLFIGLMRISFALICIHHSAHVTYVYKHPLV